MWEVFDPRCGTTVYKFRFRWVAKLVAWWYNWDYDLEGLERDE